MTTCDNSPLNDKVWCFGCMGANTKEKRVYVCKYQRELCVCIVWSGLENESKRWCEAGQVPWWWHMMMCVHMMIPQSFAYVWDLWRNLVQWSISTYVVCLHCVKPTQKWGKKIVRRRSKGGGEKWGKWLDGGIWWCAWAYDDATILCMRTGLVT